MSDISSQNGILSKLSGGSSCWTAPCGSTSQGLLPDYLYKLATEYDTKENAIMIRPLKINILSFTLLDLQTRVQKTVNKLAHAIVPDRATQTTQKKEKIDGLYERMGKVGRTALYLLGFTDEFTAEDQPHFTLRDIPPQADVSCCGVVVLFHIESVRRDHVEKKVQERIEFFRSVLT